MLGRAFFSLYGLVVLSLLVMGVVLDATVNTEDNRQLSPAEAALVNLVTALAQDAPAFLAATPIQGLDIQSLAFEDVASSQSLARLQAGETLVINTLQDTGQEQREIFTRVSDTDLLHLILAQPQQAPSYLYPAVLLVFYFSLGLVMLFWLWPLVRDLRQLASYVNQVGQSQPLPVPVLAKTSAVYRLAEAFRAMEQRITSLLSCQQEMTYAVSHELRTPLARMQFAVALAETGLDSEPSSPLRAKLEPHLHSLRWDVDEMDRMVNQLLSYAGFEQNQQPLQAMPGDLVALLTRLQRQAQSRPPQKIPPLRWDIQVTPQCEGLYCDWYLMERVLANLMDNAQRFAREHILITADCHKGTAQIRVHDDGPGIAPQDYATVFESFIRLKNTQNSDARGFGLGLAIVRRLVQWHQGQVSIEASHLGGACFVVSWPQPSLLLREP
jgi:two-component system, OmpR family, sensor kinase